jgi:hypothetical protein
LYFCLSTTGYDNKTNPFESVFRLFPKAKRMRVDRNGQLHHNYTWSHVTVGVQTWQIDRLIDYQVRVPKSLCNVCRNGDDRWYNDFDF